ncbi:DUF6134 family protein [Roseococcus suduntuyensis]|uniref:DUF3108 domain-containing protein n=1 Tax=Roseococcus suduntuyensis TaxID=455361 RepID=A0A840AE80_9PROT|nr:DUF6134 family protein [Roseococcus suduntuyensis]MBB3898793.1 hypothetical protein [Roseococcus suduntuyensis]
MILRRALPLLLAASPGTALSQGRGLPPREAYRWRVMRQGSAIGTHNVTFTQRGEEVVALSDVTITPSFLGVVVYRYEHRYSEVTRGGRFVSVASRLNRNGTIIEVEARAGANGVEVQGPEGALRLPSGYVPLSWWEPQRFGGQVPLFGTSTGRPFELRWAREALAGGGTRWRTAGEIEAVLDYTAEGRWVGYSVRGDDGVTVSYAPA